MMINKTSRQDHFQCEVSKVALYSLPSNLKIDSVDFEQCILECIKNKLDERKPENGLSKRIIHEINIHNDLMLTPVIDSSNNQHHQQQELNNYCVAIHQNKLLWTVVPVEEQLPLDIRDYNCYMQSSFDEIKLCYVNYQMPNLIIWLILSVPKRVVKNNVNQCESAKLQCGDVSSTTTNNKQKFFGQLLKHDSLFALVWKCFNEQDAVQLREMYKYLQSRRRLNQSIDYHHHPNETYITFNNRFKRNTDSTDQSDGKMNDTNESSSSSQKFSILASFHSWPGTGTKQHNQLNDEQMKLTRQRQPAKIIQETSSPSMKSSSVINLRSHLSDIISHKCDSSPKSTSTKQNKKYLNQMYKCLNKSESEFDTTQINFYLKNKRGFSSRKNPRGNGQQQQGGEYQGSHHNHHHVRSRSVDSSRQKSPDNNNNSTTGAKLIPILKHNNNRHNIRSFTDLLNSEGSSLSDESSSGEFNEINLGEHQQQECCHHHHSQNNDPLIIKKPPSVMKSVLKKSSSSSFGNENQNNTESSTSSSSSSSSSLSSKALFSSTTLQLLSDKFVRFGSNSSNNNKNKQNFPSNNSHQNANNSITNSSNSNSYCSNKKNVTFSAYATVQVVDT